MTESAQQDLPIELIPMTTLARTEATNALKAIKLGQFNGNDGLTRARAVIGELSSYIFNLVIDNLELQDVKLHAEMAKDSARGGKPLTKAQKAAEAAETK